MEPTNGKPVRKQRRWLIAALAIVLAAASSTCWWYWPRVDARFVGKWDIRLGATPDHSEGVFELQSHGSGWHPMQRIPFWIPSWKTRKDELVIGNNPNGRKTDFDRVLERYLAAWTGLEIDDTERVFEVLAVTDRRIDLRMKADGRDFIFLRLTE
jgi:hypothetical protein